MGATAALAVIGDLVPVTATLTAIADLPHPSHRRLEEMESP